MLSTKMPLGNGTVFLLGESRPSIYALRIMHEIEMSEAFNQKNHTYIQDYASIIILFFPGTLDPKPAKGYKRTLVRTTSPRPPRAQRKTSRSLVAKSPNTHCIGLRV